MDQFCFEVKPGGGRLARCLKEQLTEQEKPGYTDAKISETCKADLDKFIIDKAGEAAQPIHFAAPSPASSVLPGLPSCYCGHEGPTDFTRQYAVQAAFQTQKLMTLRHQCRKHQR